MGHGSQICCTIHRTDDLDDWLFAGVEVAHRAMEIDIQPPANPVWTALDLAQSVGCRIVAPYGMALLREKPDQADRGMEECQPKS